ncbi:MAG TPA: hypothetical protein VNU97_12855 [Rhizomicrobium sp.]|jgi:hypothetical protein|nr:hypothetical protein [Rhizomicrobium sp.]
MDATRTTTPPEAGAAGDRGRRLFAWALLIFAVAIVVLSGNYLRHDLALYRLHAVAHAIRFGEPVTTAQLAQVSTQAIDWDRTQALDASDLDDAAQVVSLFAERNRGNAFLAPALLATAEKLLKERVAAAPADGNSWLRLAYIRAAMVGLDPLAHDALRMSWLVTPREFSVMWPSLKFRSSHWADMTVEEQFAAADLAAGLWHKPPERDALRRYLAQLPPQLLATLLADMTDADARAALSRS